MYSDLWNTCRNVRWPRQCCPWWENGRARQTDGRTDRHHTTACTLSAKDAVSVTRLLDQPYSCNVKSWLTPTDRATRCVTAGRHGAVYKAGRLLQRLEKSSRGIYVRLRLEVFEFSICLISILQLHGALCPWSESLDPGRALPRTPCICSKSHTRNDCKYLFAHIKRICSNRNKSRNKSTSANISHLKRLAEARGIKN